MKGPEAAEFAAVAIPQLLVSKASSLRYMRCEILQELMQQKTSVEYTKNVTDDQMEAMAGGEAIQYQVGAFGVTRNIKVV